MLLIVTLGTENFYTPKKGLYWLRKGTRQLVALKSDEDLASARQKYGNKVPLKMACECIASPSPGKKLYFAAHLISYLSTGNSLRTHELWRAIGHSIFNIQK